ETSGRRQLDPVGARAERRAYDVTHRLGTVDDVLRTAGVRWDERRLGAGSGEIGVSVVARLADQRHRDLDGRSADGPGGERLAKASVGAGEIANERHTGPERHSCVPRRL